MVSAIEFNKLVGVLLVEKDLEVNIKQIGVVFVLGIVGILIELVTCVCF